MAWRIERILALAVWERLSAEQEGDSAPVATERGIV